MPPVRNNGAATLDDVAEILQARSHTGQDAAVPLRPATPNTEWRIRTVAEYAANAFDRAAATADAAGWPSTVRVPRNRLAAAVETPLREVAQRPFQPGEAINRNRTEREAVRRIRTALDDTAAARPPRVRATREPDGAQPDLRPHGQVGQRAALESALHPHIRDYRLVEAVRSDGLNLEEAFRVTLATIVGPEFRARAHIALIQLGVPDAEAHVCSLLRLEVNNDAKVVGLLENTWFNGSSIRNFASMEFTKVVNISPDLKGLLILSCAKATDLLVRQQVSPDRHQGLFEKISAWQKRAQLQLNIAIEPTNSTAMRALGYLGLGYFGGPDARRHFETALALSGLGLNWQTIAHIELGQLGEPDAQQHFMAARRLAVTPHLRNLAQDSLDRLRSAAGRVADTIGTDPAEPHGIPTPVQVSVSQNAVAGSSQGASQLRRRSADSAPEGEPRTKRERRSPVASGPSRVAAMDLLLVGGPVEVENEPEG